MKTYRVPAFLVAAVLVTAAFAGCYTQVGSVREGRDEGYGNDTYSSADNQAVYDTTAADSSQYGDDYAYDQCRREFYNESYYPAIEGGWYYDPWWWGPGFSFVYSPFWWCGTYDPWYYAGWYRPYFGYGPYWGGYYGHGYYGSRNRWFGVTRGRGTTRTVGLTRGGPVGYGSAAGVTGRVSTGRTGVVTPGVSRNGNPGVTTGGRTVGRSRPSSVRTATPRGTARGTVRAYQPRARYSPPAAHGGRTYSPPAGRGSYGGGRSYSPPPSRGGGSSGGHGSSGSRGGGRR